MKIEKYYDLPYPISSVYNAWVSSDTVISPATAMDINPEVGGHYRLIMESPEFTARNEGKFLLVEPGKHIVYTWEWNSDGEVSEIDVEFTDTRTGTGIKIVHSGFLSAESVSNHDRGWDSYIEGFKAFLDN